MPRLARVYSRNEKKKTRVMMETIRLPVDAFLYVPYPKIGEQNAETSIMYPRFPRKSGTGRAKTVSRAPFTRYSSRPTRPSKRELGEHPVRKDRGECKCGLGANASPVALGGFKRSGRKTDADRYALCRFSRSNRINMPVRTRARAPARRDSLRIGRRRVS